MATFSVGDFAYQSWSNSYVLDLIVSEESINIADNTSRVTYALQLRSGSNNRFSARLGANIAVNGSVVNQSDASGINIEPYYDHTYSLLSGYVDVGHNADGSGAVTIQGSIWVIGENSYAPPNMSVEGSIALTHIARASQVTISQNTTEIGGQLTIYTNRQGNFQHTLTYSWGNLAAVIAENVEDSYTWTVPDILAGEIPGSYSGYGDIWCNTYLNGNYIGNSHVQFWATVPNTEKTRPSVTLSVTPVQPDSVPDKLREFYIQGITRLQAAITANVWYSEAKGCGISVQNGAYGGSTPISDLLMLSGKHNVTAWVTDMREYTGTATAEIYVQPYRKPNAVEVDGENSVICCRCSELGEPDINGRHILLKARRSWYSLGGLNMCTMKYRFRQEYGDWGEWITFLDASAPEDEFTGVLEQELEPRFAYEIEIAAEDEISGAVVLQRTIPTAGTPLHLGAGGRNLGLGRYCDYSHQDAVNVGWDMFLDKELYMTEGTLALLRDGFFPRGVLPYGTDYNEVSVPGVYRIRDDYGYINRSDIVDPAYLIVFNPLGGYDKNCVLQMEFNYSGSQRKIRSVWYGVSHDWTNF